MYAVMPYAVATGVVELPYLLVQSLIFVPIAYFMIGFKIEVEAIFLFVIVFTQSIAVYTFMGQMFSYCCPTAQIATMLGGLNHLIWNIFNGFLVPIPIMAAGWSWLNYISATTYVIYSLSASQLGQLTQPIIVPGPRAPPLVHCLLQLQCTGWH
jgi:ABC-type multidrug transport system permease subunit